MVTIAINPEYDLTISRTLVAPRSLVWKAWADPAHLKAWWCPKPWQTEVLAFDFRPGGAFHTFMRGPDGGVSDNPGCFLEIVPEQRIVMTSMLVADWRPANTWMPMTAIITLEDAGGGTRYSAHVMHKDAAAREQHEKMGFHEGWGICIGQLDDYAISLTA